VEREELLLDEALKALIVRGMRVIRVVNSSERGEVSFGFGSESGEEHVSGVQRVDKVWREGRGLLLDIDLRGGEGGEGAVGWGDADLLESCEDRDRQRDREAERDRRQRQRETGGEAERDRKRQSQRVRGYSYSSDLFCTAQWVVERRRVV
jgi:hypothetical protein